MFKKSFKTSNHSEVAGKDKKKLKLTLLKLMDKESVEKFMEHCEVLTSDKISGTKILLYCNDHYPVLVDATGKGDYYPTLYSAGAFPRLIKNIYVEEETEILLKKGGQLMWGGITNETELGEFKSDDVICVRNNITKSPVAIAAMAVSSEDRKEKGPEGQAAYVLHIMNDKLWEAGPQEVPKVIFDPSIFAKVEVHKKEESNSEEDESDSDSDSDGAEKLLAFGKIMNQGKGVKTTVSVSKGNTSLASNTKSMSIKDEIKREKEQKKMENDQKNKSKKAKKELEEEEEEKQIGKGKKKGNKKGEEEPREKDSKKGKGKAGQKDQLSSDEEVEKSGKGKNKSSKENNQNDAKDKKNNKKNENKEKDATKEKAEKQSKKKKDVEESKEPAEEEAPVPPKVMDEYIREICLNSLILHVKDKDLPIDASEFWNKYIAPYKKDNIAMNIKYSTHGKLGKFFSTLVKEDILVYAEGKKGGAPQITKINRECKVLEDWQPTVTQTSKKHQEDFEEKKTDKAAGWKKTVDIIELCQPQSNLKSIFQIEVEDNKYFTMADAKKYLDKFLKDKKLLEKNSVLVNQDLIAIFGSQIANHDQNAETTEETQESKEEAEGKKKKTRKGESQKYIPKTDLLTYFNNSLNHYYKIVNHATPGKDVIKSGAFSGIQVNAEKTHNKSVNTIIGLEMFGYDLEKVASHFQTQFSCPVSVHEVPGKGSKKEIIVNGNFIDQIHRFLLVDCQIEESLVKIKNKLDKKKNFTMMKS